MWKEVGQSKKYQVKNSPNYIPIIGDLEILPKSGEKKSGAGREFWKFLNY